MSEIINHGDGIYESPNKGVYLSGVKAAITIGQSSRIFEKPDADPIPNPNTKYRKIVPWGENNDLPKQVLDKVKRSEIVSANLFFNILVTYGSGIEYGRIVRDERGLKKLEPVEVQEIEDFFEMNDIRSYLLKEITNLQLFGIGFPELIMNNDVDGKRKVIGIDSKQGVFSRWEEMNPKTGYIENHFYSAKWGETITEKDIVVTPVLKDYATVLDAMQRTGKRPNEDGKLKDLKEARFIVPVSIPTEGRLYYSHPYWWSMFDSGWYDFAVAIPEFKKYIMTNQATIKYHIELTDDYFNRIFNAEGITDPVKKQERTKREYQDLNKFLSNTKNTGKSVISFTRYSHEGKELASMKIKVIENHYKGGEYIEDSEEASNILSYAMGVHPSLNGSSPGKNKTINGTEARELFIIKQALMKPIRDMLLKPFYVIKNLNGWPKEIQFEIPNLMLTTLDQGTGSQKIIS